MSQRTVTHVTGHKLSALVESAAGEKTLPRYQIGDSMELDNEGQLISYEEYSPFGAVTYSSMHREVKASREYLFQRYKHDRETGLYHCGARYYCPWLGRWTSPDPSGDVDGPNLYQYVNNDPINFDDHSGRCRRGISAPQRREIASVRNGLGKLSAKVEGLADRVHHMEVSKVDQHFRPRSTRKNGHLPRLPGKLTAKMDEELALTVDLLDRGGENVMGVWGKKQIATAQGLNSEVREVRQHLTGKTKLFRQHVNYFFRAVNIEADKYDKSITAEVLPLNQELKGELRTLDRVKDDQPSTKTEIRVMGRVLSKVDNVVKAFGGQHPIHNPGGGAGWGKGF
ncbi:hypothetical protein B0J15DRAFT_595248 [Fusarium solani]|uniref:RHS repeat-associated core domain-containing protein n=2 Tax=Fusarium solani TaxID=169388 RepID=A0A9P9KEZ8_FUSSL|nr:uncharacterized protein B0J15DRAFT_595248 [Fusarium solani]KAH7254861.1 hypothetical protein B0J15DRAFT_595248 [Fusarium solani]